MTADANRSVQVPGAGALDARIPSPEALDSLVYLVGPARGGTSIIHAAMDVHPGAMVLPGVTYFMQHVWRYRRTVHERLLLEIMRMPNFWVEAAIKGNTTEAEYAAFNRMVRGAFAAKTLAGMYKLYPVAYALTPGFTKPPAAIACWHDKHNDWRHLGPIARAFPGARFIFVVRDPRSVALSGARRLAMQSDGKGTGKGASAVIEMALYWRLLVQRCLQFAAAHPERCVVVRYEDFVASPARELNRVFAMTTGQRLPDAEIESGLARLIGGATNDPGRRYQGISQDPLTRWKKDLAPDDIAAVERLTAPTARKLGYDVSRRGGLGGLVDALGSIDRAGGLRPALKTLVSEAYELAVRPPGAGWAADGRHG